MAKARKPKKQQQNRVYVKAHSQKVTAIRKNNNGLFDFIVKKLFRPKRKH